ncbi:hypothetical protein ACWTQY_27545, partial [Klebsiella pneumoniae]
MAPVPPASEQRYRMIEDEQFEPHWRTPVRRAAEHWWIASYSALRLDEDAPSLVSRHEDAAPDSPAMQNAIDDENPLLALAPLPASAQGLHRFPRGPNPGTFLHGLLEMTAQEGFAALAQEPSRLREALARRCQRRGLEN